MLISSSYKKSVRNVKIVKDIQKFTKHDIQNKKVVGLIKMKNTGFLSHGYKYIRIVTLKIKTLIFDHLNHIYCIKKIKFFYFEDIHTFL